MRPPAMSISLHVCCLIYSFLFKAPHLCFSSGFFLYFLLYILDGTAGLYRLALACLRPSAAAYGAILALVIWPSFS